jgi:hypothetical protein
MAWKKKAEEPVLTESSDVRILRLECVKVASGNYRRSAEIIQQAAELMSYIETGCDTLGKP